MGMVKRLGEESELSTTERGSTRVDDAASFAHNNF
jgi:hypothetical protein